MLILPFHDFQRLNRRNKRNRFHYFMNTSLIFFPFIFDDYSALKPKSEAFSRNKTEVSYDENH